MGGPSRTFVYAGALGLTMAFGQPVAPASAMCGGNILMTCGPAKSGAGLHARKRKRRALPARDARNEAGETRRR